MRGEKGEVVSGTEREEEPDREVSLRQRYAIQLLLEGRKDSDIARLVGIRQAQLRRWKEHPRFRDALARARPVRNIWMLQAAVLCESRMKSSLEPETAWTSRKEGEGDG